MSYTRDPKSGIYWQNDATTNQMFLTDLHVVHSRKMRGKMREVDSGSLGPGLVTNTGVFALANDWQIASGKQALKLANNHASGTGSTAAASTDIGLGTPAGPVPVAGTQSNVSTANSAQYKTVATLTYGTSLAITEWGLYMDTIAGWTSYLATGSPATATSATTLTSTGTSLVSNGYPNYIVVAGTVWGYILSNTTSVITILSGWFKTVDGTAGSTPGSTQAYTLQPIMWDRKVFSAINVANTDTIQFTYTLTVNSGG